jgi:hypothetical protein
MEDGRRFAVSQSSDLAISPNLDRLIVATVGEKVEFLQVEKVREALLTSSAVSA